MAIDNPFDAIDQQYQTQPSNLALELTLKGIEKLTPGLPGAAISIANLLRSRYSLRASLERVEAMCEVLKAECLRHEKKINDLEVSLVQKVANPVFGQALLIGAEVSIRSLLPDIPRKVGAILGNSLALFHSDAQWQDATSFILDLERLTERDLAVLQFFYAFQGRIIHVDPSRASDPNNFLDSVLKIVEDSKRELRISADEFYAVCFRLVGFGLIVELPRTNTRWGPSDYGFRLTLRGKLLIELLGRQPLTKY